MATAKKPGKGAPASAGLVRQKKLTRKEKSAANKARYAEVRATSCQEVREQRESRLETWPRKQYNASDVYRGWSGGKSKSFEPPYTKELDAQLFDLISVGTSLDTIVALEGMPDLPVLLRWLADERHPLYKTNSRARALLPQLWEDRALQIALNPAVGVVKTKRQVLDKFGGVVDVEDVREGDNVERAKLAMSAYTWALGWMTPKKHGRQADPSANQPNDQLKALFDSLKSGPAE